MLEVDELREHVGEGPSDDVLERLLTAAYQAIDNRVGPAEEEISESLLPSGSLVHLSFRASAVTAVLEGTIELEESDYELRSGRKSLRRLVDGRPAPWRARVEVTYEPQPAGAERDRVAIALVNLDLNYEPGMTGSTVGSWAEQYAQGDRTYKAEREAILSSLRHPTVGVW